MYKVWVVLGLGFISLTQVVARDVICHLPWKGARIYEYIPSNKCRETGGTIVPDHAKFPSPSFAAPPGLDPRLELEGFVPSDASGSDLARCWLKSKLGYGVHGVTSRFLCNRLGGQVLKNLDTGRASLRALRRRNRPIGRRTIAGLIECRINDINEFVYGDQTRLMCRSLGGMVMEDLDFESNPDFDGSIYRSRYKDKHMLAVTPCLVKQGEDFILGEMTLRLCNIIGAEVLSDDAPILKKAQGTQTQTSEKSTEVKSTLRKSRDDNFSIQQKKLDRYHEGKISFDDLVGDGD